MNQPAFELGSYRLLDRIGEGGSGQVYRAEGPSGIVAVKMLGPAADLDDAARARFSREIAALGQLAHPNLVRLIDHGIDPELGPYLVTPLLAGANLRSLARLCPEAALLVIQPVVEATAALHASGYVHRDLKPENVIAAPDGAITVIDLGLAWRDGMTRHTDTGAAVGSVGYMAPEQIEGRAVDAKVDIWALGVMLYEMIAGKRPFARPRAAEEAAAALLGVCAKLTAVYRRASPQLAALVARCLAIDPAQRPAARELATAIATLIEPTEADLPTVVADPIAFQARVARGRALREETLARVALATGKTFEALAHCDRGLAYVPDHPGLLAVVGHAETHHPLPARATRLWPWLAGAAVILVGAGITAKLVTGASRDPWSEPSVAMTAPPATSISAMTDDDKKLVGGFVSVFSRAADRRDATATPDSDRALGHDMVGVFGDALTRAGLSLPPPDPHAGERIPTTSAGWLQRAAGETPAAALASVRHAVELDPASPAAQLALCIMLAANQDATAVGQCTTVLAKTPNEPYALLARGRARTAAGDQVGAKLDLDAACKLGRTSACR